MNFKYNSETGLTDVILDTSDICIFCEYCGCCPLIEAIMINLVYPSADNLTITECPMFVMADLLA